MSRALRDPSQPVQARSAALRQRLLVHQRAPLPVVKIALLLRQAGEVAFDEATLEKPARRARREDEQPRELELLRPLLDLAQEGLAISSAPEIGSHGKRGQLAGPLLAERI